MNGKRGELRLINLQEKLIIIFICCLTISFLLNHNNRLRRTTGKPIWTTKETQMIAAITNVVVFLAILGEIYLNIKDREILINNDCTPKELRLIELELFVSVTAAFLSLITLYTIINSERDIIYTDNPNL